MISRLSCALLVVLCSAVSTRAAQLIVHNTNDGLAGSLRQAIQDAASGDTIVFQIPTSSPGYNPNTGIYTVSLTSGTLIINKSLRIDGGGQKITVRRSAVMEFRIFEVTPGATVELTGLTISHGAGPSFGGGGVANGGSLTISNCTFEGNSGPGGEGGAIINAGTLRVRNSTFSGNSALQAGAISNQMGATLRIDNSTISQNSGTSSDFPLGALLNRAGSSAVVVRNSIIVGNTSPQASKDVYGNFTSEGYNLIGTTTGSSGFGQTGDQLGANSAQANLSPLQDNGGPTRTMRPRPGSVAIDQGNRGLDSNNQPINTDQRGYARPIDLQAMLNAVSGDGSDIGAVETGPLQTGPNFLVTNTRTDFAAGPCAADDCTFLSALTAANANPDPSTITFAPGVGPVIVNESSDTGYPITAPLNIVGPGARQLAVTGSGVGLFRIFNVVSPDVIISGLTLRDGRVAGLTDFGRGGGAIYNGGGLTLIDCTIMNSIACNCGGGIPADGGGLYNAAGATVMLSGCTFTGNSADQFGGGAVFNAGTLMATNCTFYGNSAPSGGGILSVANNGNSLVILRNCTIANNTATSAGSSTAGGGGYYGEGGVGNSLHRFSNTIIAGNTNAVNPDLRGYGTTEGNNLIGNLGQIGSGFTNGVTGDKVGVNAQFYSFGNHGGPTDTLSLRSNSAARNAGSNAAASPTDQRGYPRVGVADIGAFEYASALDGLRITAATRVGNDYLVQFSEAVAGTTYRLERNPNPSQPPMWQPATSDFTAMTTGNAAITAVNALSQAPAQFYRITIP